MPIARLTRFAEYLDDHCNDRIKQAWRAKNDPKYWAEKGGQIEWRLVEAEKLVFDLKKQLAEVDVKLRELDQSKLESERMQKICADGGIE